VHPRLSYERHGAHARAILNLVVPLVHPATVKRITETAGNRPCRSSAVTPLIGASLRQGDVNSTALRSTQRTTPGIRTSTMATRTTTTRTTSFVRAQSADFTLANHADFLFSDLLQAYFNCRQSKRNSASALAFEQHMGRNLYELYEELLDGSYKPGRSICFVVTRPKPREVWAADFRDRIVHHLLYNKIAPRFYASFIADSCACIPGRGTLYAAKRLENKIRSASQNWSRPIYYLKCDLANFFVSIDKHVLRELLAKRVTETWWLALTDLVLWHDPRQDFELRGGPDQLRLVPAHKQLTNQPAHCGLPIGNLSSQFFANVYLDVLDQFVKHRLRCRHYIRYVDDFLLLHESPQWLNNARERIDTLLREQLHAQLNPRKTILQPVARGADFVGQIIKPWRRITRRRTVEQALRRTAAVPMQDMRETANSYFGLLGQASHSRSDREHLAKIVLRRGRAVNIGLTKIYRGA
jgi:retron-type reverse transcriptase